MSRWWLLPCLVLMSCAAWAQPAALPLPPTRNADEVIASLPALARAAQGAYTEPDRARELLTRFRLHSVAGDHLAASRALQEVVAMRTATQPDTAAPLRLFEVVEHAWSRGGSPARTTPEQYRDASTAIMAPLGDRAAALAWPWFEGDPASLDRAVRDAAGAQVGKRAIALADAIALVRLRHTQLALEGIAPLRAALAAADDARRYHVEPGALVSTPDGAQVHVIVMRPRRAAAPQPTLLRFTIYHDLPTGLANARDAAARGYAGVVGYTRGKGLSPQDPVPYEHDGDDARAVIAWITRQPWSDGRVGMYGGSYDGFTQWAVAKHPPAALRTIVPWAANNPGNGLPMENNVVIFANYAWPFHVTNDKGMDFAVYGDRARWGALNGRWYASGASFRDIDRVDGTPNPWFRRWLEHPAYDAYWQALVPHGAEYAAIDIPVLTVTGYFDDGQRSAVGYMREHLAQRPGAPHYLVIGPWDHGATQASRKPPMHGGYAIDPVAAVDTPELMFQWMDHVFRGAPLPALLQDRVNYQVMGANAWKHAPSIAAMGPDVRRYYLGAGRDAAHHALRESPDAPVATIDQVVDFADRTSTLGDHYPYPVVGKALDASSGLVFESAPLPDGGEVSGLFSGELHVTVDRRDFDYSVTLYERMPSGELFHLSYIVARASYARDPTTRTLLVPGTPTRIAFDQTRMTSRRLQPGSTLVAVVTVNKNPNAQVNHGTGGDVNDETPQPGEAPMRVQWHTDSYIAIPFARPGPDDAP